MENQRFFEEKYANLTEDFASADGFNESVYMDGVGVGDSVYQDGFNSNKPKAKALIFTVANTTTTDITDVEILDANTNFKADGNGLVAGVTVTYNIPGKSYSDLLGMLISTPMEVAMTRLKSSNTSQLEAPFTLETSDMFGRTVQDVVTPTANEFAQNTTIVVDETGYILNGQTKITISTLYASASCTWRMYPKVVASSVNALQSNTARKFVNPNISGMKTLGR